MIFMKLLISLYIFLLIFFVIEDYDNRPWTQARKRGEIRFDENGIVMKIGKTIYTAVGYFSNSSKLTAKDKIERIIKKESGKNQ